MPDANSPGCPGAGPSSRKLCGSGPEGGGGGVPAGPAPGAARDAHSANCASPAGPARRSLRTACNCFHWSGESLARKASRKRALAFSSSARAWATRSICARIADSLGWSALIIGSRATSAFSTLARMSMRFSRCCCRISSIDLRWSSVRFSFSTTWGSFHQRPWAPPRSKHAFHGGPV